MKFTAALSCLFFTTFASAAMFVLSVETNDTTLNYQSLTYETGKDINYLYLGEEDYQYQQVNTVNNENLDKSVVTVLFEQTNSLFLNVESGYLAFKRDASLIGVDVQDGSHKYLKINDSEEFYAVPYPEGGDKEQYRISVSTEEGAIPIKLNFITLDFVTKKDRIGRRIITTGNGVAKAIL
ncbi:hypothetical protein G210_2292 [Candida maltosa Xu316]|uniref:Cell wall protein n=1 Tax=Candida maltosa (strain Xu316) TaxID=1245528 RepID=M3JY78_CANMX|nr:hypothetical protein G210_2292 [Candida maltosa Xu316]